MSATVLILTHEDDAHAERLSDELSRIGARAIRIPRTRISEFRVEAMGDRLLLSGPKVDPMDARDLSAVFLRCLPRSIDFGSEDGVIDLAPESYIGLQRESIFYDWLHTLSLYVPFYNQVPATSRAGGKIFQRAIAGRVGLSVPDEYAGEDPISARAFADSIWRQQREVCTKAFANKNLIVGGARLTRYTELLDRAKAEDLSDLSGCPLIFQGYIEKAYELRVTVIGQHVLACRIDSQEAGGATATDWRRYNLPRTPHRQYELPADVRQKLLDFHLSAGLGYSAFDLVRSVDGDYIFLETNAFGQWLWIEDLTGLMITGTIANVLAGRA